jgi:Putative Actinobacterial Holin-X, holin superfamily III
MTMPPQPPGTARPPADDATVGVLVSRMTEQISQLVREEFRLAQLETTRKAKKLGLGAGLFGGAGLVAVYGVGALVAAAIMGLAAAVPGWLAAVIVAVVLFAIAGLLALVGKKDVQAGAPPVPRDAMHSVRTDIETIKESARR